jgi:murein L,D-transpeptidase YcbB/YkuD
MLVFLLSCKEKEPPKKIFIPKIEITEEGKIIPIDTSRIANINDSSVIAFYNAIQNKTFWTANSNRKEIIAIFNNALDEGLFPKDFETQKINNFEENIKKLSESELVAYDLLLTENLSKYVKKVSKGSLNPSQIYSNWDLKENTINFNELLLNFQKEGSIKNASTTAAPNYIVYKKLKTALAILNKLPDYNFNKIEIDQKIVLNDTNSNIVEIKKILIYWKDLKPLDTLTEIYDEDTELAVKKFQMRHGLATDGVIGFGTVNALNHSKKDRIKQVIVNMERWRWYPRYFEPSYLIVNIPNYTLYAVNNSDTLRTHNVIIGKSTRKTPVLSSNLTHLIFNPTWTIPPTILKNDVIPAAKSNIEYFKNKNITIYNTNNQVVNPNNWDSKNARNYRYIQSPGTSNSLGLVKFMFPNRFSVYLHDTNSRGYFEKEIRALSSGCVRVQYPFELAEYLLNDAEKWNLEKINEAVNSKKTMQVNFKEKIPIHILYWTAWSENGTLQFRDDLYNYDVGIYEKLSE